MGKFGDWVTGQLVPEIFNFGQGAASYSAQSKLQKQSAALQLQNWEAMTENTRNWNEYAEKAEKMMEAGINPLWSDGQAQQASISAAAPSAPSPSFGSAQPLPPTWKLQYDKMKAEIDYIKANKDKTEAEGEFIKEVNPTNIAIAKQNLEKLKVDTEAGKEQVAYIRSGIVKNSEEVYQKWNELELEWAKYHFQRDNTLWYRGLQEQQTEAQTIEAQASKMNATTNYWNYKKNAEKIDKEIEQIDAETQAITKRVQIELGKNAADILHTLVTTDVASVPLALFKSLGVNINNSKETFEEFYGPQMVGIYKALVNYGQNCPPEQVAQVAEAAFKVSTAINNLHVPYSPLEPLHFKSESNYNMPWNNNSSY